MESSRAVRRFTDTAIGRATNTARHSGDGWAERHLEATNFGLPPGRDPRMRARRTEPTATHEVHGATYSVTPLSGDDRHAGDPTPHGVPPEYSRPRSVLDLIVAGAPRALPVTQEIPHGPDQSRSAEFDAALQEAADLGAYHGAIGFYDRRYEGRRHRAGHLYEALREPPTRGGWQREVNTNERLTKF